MADVLRVITKQTNIHPDSKLQIEKTPSLRNHILHQILPVSRLIQGNYDGVMPYKQVKKYGDFGVGAFDKLDGEMVALNGKFYQIKSNGQVSLSINHKTTPFASVHFFKCDYTKEMTNISDFEALKKQLTPFIYHKNMIYGIKIKAHFTYIKLRSPKAQEKPYTSLKNTLKSQSIFEIKDIKGTLVGHFIPTYFEQIMYFPGFHFHFISDDKKVGGHVLDVQISRAIADFDKLSGIQRHLFELENN